MCRSWRRCPPPPDLYRALALRAVIFASRSSGLLFVLTSAQQSPNHSNYSFFFFFMTCSCPFIFSSQFPYFSHYYFYSSLMIRLRPIIAVQTYISGADYKREDAAAVFMLRHSLQPPPPGSVPPAAAAEIHNRRPYLFFFLRSVFFLKDQICDEQRRFVAAFVKLFCQGSDTACCCSECLTYGASLRATTV